MIQAYPSPGYRLIVTLLSSTQHNLSYASITEHEQDERSHELREGLSKVVAYSGPHQRSVHATPRLLLSRITPIDQSAMLGVW